MDAECKLQIEQEVVKMLRTVYDPEIPVNIYDLGLIYRIDLKEDGVLEIDMTLTSPSCPAADFIMMDVVERVESVDGVARSQVELVFDPEWSQEMMSEEAQAELGFL